MTQPLKTVYSVNQDLFSKESEPQPMSLTPYKKSIQYYISFISIQNVHFIYFYFSCNIYISITTFIVSHSFADQIMHRFSQLQFVEDMYHYLAIMCIIQVNHSNVNDSMTSRTSTFHKVAFKTHLTC
jgi:hypothetical protein